MLIGALASSGATQGGYVNVNALRNITVQMRKSFPSFGGVMLWDASQAYGSWTCGFTNEILLGQQPTTDTTKPLKVHSPPRKGQAISFPLALRLHTPLELSILPVRRFPLKGKSYPLIRKSSIDHLLNRYIWQVRLRMNVWVKLLISIY